MYLHHENFTRACPLSLLDVVLTGSYLSWMWFWLEVISLMWSSLEATSLGCGFGWKLSLLDVVFPGFQLGRKQGIRADTQRIPEAVRSWWSEQEHLHAVCVPRTDATVRKHTCNDSEIAEGQILSVEIRIVSLGIQRVVGTWVVRYKT